MEQPALNMTVVLVAFIGGLPALITAVVAAIITLRRQSIIAEQVDKVEKATNHMKDALVQATAESSLAEGKVQGRAAERESQARKKR
jgi:uncharacterized protein YaaN involved in tellurite resistance